MVQWKLALHLDCREVLRNIGVDGSNIYMPDEIKIIPCNNDLERLGVIAKGLEFIRSFTNCYEETFDDVMDYTSSDRGGRFDCNKNYFIKNNDNFYIGAFVHIGNNALAEIRSKKKDCIVSYVKL